MSNNNNTTTGIARRIYVPGIFDRILTPAYTPSPIKFFDVEWSKIIPSTTTDINNLFKACAICGNRHSEIMMHWSDVGLVCEICKKEYTRPCDDCGTPMLFDHPDLTPHVYAVIGLHKEHKFVCQRCVAEYRLCSECKLLHHHGTSLTINGNRYCRECASEFYTTHSHCDSCGTTFPKELAFKDNERNYCQACWMQKKLSGKRKEIKDYGKTKGIVFLATKGGVSRYYGLEIEGQNGRSPSNQPIEMLQELSEFQEIELKEDGSVSHGFEVVTYPMSLDWYKNQMKLSKLCSILNHHGFKSNDDPNAGFHVHISRDAFGDTPRKISKHLAGFTYLWDRPEFRSQIRIFTRRENKATRGALDPYRYCRFFDMNWNGTVGWGSSCGSSDPITITKGYVKCVSMNKADRYTVLNYHMYGTNPDTGRHERMISDATVELRLFKGTTKRDTIIATLELIDLFADISIEITDEQELRALTWKDICAKVPSSSPELKTYLTSRKIWEE